MSPTQRKNFELMCNNCELRKIEVDNLVVSKSQVEMCSLKGMVNIIIFILYLKIKSNIFSIFIIPSSENKAGKKWSAH